MSSNAYFLPVLVQVILTLWLYIRLVREKSRAKRQGLVDEKRRALHDDAWPDKVLQINNCIRNQFEVPVLFYVLMLVAWSLQFINIVVVAIAWVFVLSRIAHAWVHTGSNYVPLRRNAFMVGCVAVMVLVAAVLYRIIVDWMV